MPAPAPNLPAGRRVRYRVGVGARGLGDRGQGQAELEAGPLAAEGGVADDQLPVLAGGQLTGDVEAEADPAGPPGGARVELGEALEDALAVGRRDPGAAVLNGEHGQGAGPARQLVLEAGEVLPVRAVPEAVLQVLGNLLDNAVQHHAAGSAITVHVSDGPGGMVRTAVSNRGPVLSEAMMARIWDRFFTTRAKQGGTGLGLAIVASIVKAHGGAVSVTSTAEDGTTFCFDLPRR